MTNGYDSVHLVRSALASVDRTSLPTKALDELESRRDVSRARQKYDLERRCDYIEDIHAGIHSLLLSSGCICTPFGSSAQASRIAQAALVRDLRDLESSTRVPPEPQAVEFWCSITRKDEAGALAMLASSKFCALDVEDSNGRTALHLAALCGLAGVCAALLGRSEFTKADARDAHGYTALHYACLVGNAWIAMTIMDSLVFDVVDALAFGGISALHCAACGGHEEACEALLGHPRFSRHTADLRDEFGFTALHHAALYGHSGVCRILLGHAKFSAAALQDENGRTALHLASAEGHLDVCEEMLTRREIVGIEVRDNNGETALDLCQNGSEAWQRIYQATALLMRERWRRNMSAASDPEKRGVGPWASREAWRT